jgi:hypothetical protein
MEKLYAARLKNSFISICVILTAAFNLVAQPALIIDHRNTDVTAIPKNWIDSAKTKLHISYGHTSHGSQIIDGMSGLVGFSNAHGKGLNLPENIFAWNNNGSGNALSLHDGGMGGDVGYYPDWVNNTKEYLDDDAHADVNVIIWSWCGQVSGKYANGKLDEEYLAPMAQLELDYPHVTFVYMTGHLDHGDDANNKMANESIRNYCLQNGKVLFDFADIESYNPDGVHFDYAGDDCSYYDGTGTRLGNWAEEWRAAHTEDVDWYNCGSAHSDPLNANQKAFAAWQLWAKLAGWEAVTSLKEKKGKLPDTFALLQNYPNPFNPSTTIGFTLQVSGFTTLKIYDAVGQEVATLVNEIKEAGTYSAAFYGSHLSSGTYYAQLHSGNRVLMMKMLLLK